MKLDYDLLCDDWHTYVYRLVSSGVMRPSEGARALGMGRLDFCEWYVWFPSSLMGYGIDISYGNPVLLESRLNFDFD
jgi:hypothetical protein